MLKLEPGEPNATAALAILDEWLAKAKENKSDGKAETQEAIQRITGLNAIPTTPSTAAPAPKSPPKAATKRLCIKLAEKK